MQHSSVAIVHQAFEVVVSHGRIRTSQTAHNVLVQQDVVTARGGRRSAITVSELLDHFVTRGSINGDRVAL